jgi:uncharacterized protein (DUF305 family)
MGIPEAGTMKGLVSGFVPVALLSAVLAGCGSTPAAQTPAVIQPGAPGQASRVLSGAEAKQQLPAATAADIAFMQGMIHHHAQALDMTDLLKDRSSDPDMQKLALRIHVSQTDEIKMMQHWLEARGQEAPDPRAHHGHGMAGMEGMDHDVMMPGMLNKDEMARLAAAKGPGFDRLFLEGMIKHHGGALTMVKELFATPGAGQQSDIFAFASDVEADQQMEIDRMTAMLKERMK